MKKPLSFLFILSAFILALMFCTSCKSDPKHENTEKAVEIGRVNFYLDNSVSNAGYYGSNGFNGVIDELISNCKGYNRSLYTISDSLGIKFMYNDSNIDQLEYSSFRNNINQESSTIYSMLSRIMDNTDDSTVSVFISDGILSYPSSVIRASGNNNKNIDDINSGILKSKTISAISNSFKHTTKTASAFSIYYFTSDFNGNFYYNANNENQNFRGKTLHNRPFYIWVLTKNLDLFTAFNQKLLSLDKFKNNTNKINFGITKEEAQDITFISKKGICTLTPRNSIENVNLNDSKNKKIEILFCTNLNGIETTNLTELASELDISPKHNEFTVQFIEKDSVLSSNDFNTISDLSKKKKVLESTHFIKLTINRLYVNDTLQIIKKYQYPNWYYNKWTHDDRKFIEDGKTFGIDQIIDAFKLTMQDSTKNIVNIKIPISN